VKPEEGNKEPQQQAKQQSQLPQDQQQEQQQEELPEKRQRQCHFGHQQKVQQVLLDEGAVKTAVSRWG
jgi:hypothetical protein